MKQTSLSICAGLGDNIIARMIFDTVKNQYDEIRISHDQNVIKTWKENDPNHISFLNQIGTLLFSDLPFHFDTQQYPPIQTHKTIKQFFPIAKPNLQHLLCKGTILNTDSEYVCITTKVRMIPKNVLYPVLPQFWTTLKSLSNKYKIVIMGERNIEEFSVYRKAMSPNVTYSIYEQIVSNISEDRIIDLTVPSLGVIAPKLINVQQDGLILQHAKFAICFGNGGNLWHAIATANKIVAYKDRNDQDDGGDTLLDSNFNHVKMFRNWNEFIEVLKNS